VIERLGGVHGHAVFRFQPATLNLTVPLNLLTYHE
jgi:hypothetical protein